MRHDRPVPGQRRTNRRPAVIPALALGVLLLIPACDRNAATLDHEEDRDTFVQRALERKRAQQPDEAIHLFMQALERKPRLARAHLELGLLYDRSKEDYLRAIYHYQRYLELRPQAEKKHLIEDMIRQARLSFAAGLPNPPPGAVERMALMQKEIDSLRHHVNALAAPGAPPAAARLPAALAAPA
ncbi:MAG: hypothetical protein NTV49_04400, partial [Kiritimatiellaeota bacterium]|nr:hypothetical protein [Kiritimatiellota bacterium]